MGTFAAVLHHLANVLVVQGGGALLRGEGGLDQADAFDPEVLVLVDELLAVQDLFAEDERRKNGVLHEVAEGLEECLSLAVVGEEGTGLQIDAEAGLLLLRSGIGEVGN